MLKFIINLILFYVANILELILVPLSLPFIWYKYGLQGVKHMFDDLGLSVDIESAGRERSMWNILFVAEGGFYFKKDTPKTISRILGINEWLGTLKPFGVFVKNILWVIDVQYWFNGGHCFQSMKADDFTLPTHIKLSDGTLIKKTHESIKHNSQKLPKAKKQVKGGTKRKKVLQKSKKRIQSK